MTQDDVIKGRKAVTKVGVIFLITDEQSGHDWLVRGVVLNTEFVGSTVIYKIKDCEIYNETITI